MKKELSSTVTAMFDSTVTKRFDSTVDSGFDSVVTEKSSLLSDDRHSTY